MKSIVRPGVEIIQAFAVTNPTPSTPDLPTILVGPNYQIVDDAALGPAGAYTGALLALAWPNLEAGADVKFSSLVVKLKDIKRQIYPTTLAAASDPVAAVADVLTLTPGAGKPTFADAGVAIGDTVEVLNGGVVIYTSTIKAIGSATAITLNGEPGVANVTVRIMRVHDPVTLTYELTAAQYTALSADAKANYALDGAVYHHVALSPVAASITLAADLVLTGEPVVRATAQISYLALRRALANRILTIATKTEIASKLGVVDPRNPLALGVHLAMANTTTSVLAIGLDGEAAADWTEAIDFLGSERVYTICPLTQDAGILAHLQNHVAAMSAAAKGKFRIAWINRPQPTEAGIGTALVGGKLKLDGGVLTLTHSLAAFLGSVLVGDFVRVTVSDPATPADRAAAYRVTGIRNDSTLVLANLRYTGASGVYEEGAAFGADFGAQDVDLRVVRVLNRQGQAEQIAQIAEGYNDRRILYVTNAQVVVDLGTADAPILHTVPGYYLCAAYAGMCAGFPPHQGFTNVGVKGVKSILYGNDYYTEAQLEIIAGSGGFVVLQDDAGLPYAFIQTTTDTSIPQRRELSVTKTFDFYSFMIKDMLMRYIGVYNIVPETLTALVNSIESVHAKLLAMKYPRIGTPILAGKVKSVLQDSTKPDEVTMLLEVEIPMPLNRIRATVEVVGSVQ